MGCVPGMDSRWLFAAAALPTAVLPFFQDVLQSLAAPVRLPPALITADLLKASAPIPPALPVAKHLTPDP